MAHSTKARPTPARQPRPATRQGTRRGTRSTVSSTSTLARWQLRQTWRLLTIIGVGLLVAVALVGMIPLYAQVSESAGLRHALEADPQGGYVQVQTTNQLFDSGTINNVQSQITQVIQENLGSIVSQTPDISVQIPTLDFTPNTRAKSEKSVQTFVRLIGADASKAPGHLKLVQGRLPTNTSPGVIEFAVPATSQRELNLILNQNFTLPFDLTDQANQVTKHTLTFRLVGVFAPLDNPDPFWHGETFAQEVFTRGLATFTRYPLLVSNRELMNELDALSQAAMTQDGDNNPGFVTATGTFWYYRFDFSHVDIKHLPDIVRGLSSTLVGLNNNPQEPPYAEQTTSLGPISILLSYGQRVAVVSLPILSLTILIGGLLLFFVVVMIDLLVERQVTAITLVRSRGASGRQVFGSLLWQGLTLSLIAFVAGPFLAILLVVLLVQLTLQPADFVSLHLITDKPLMVAQGLTQNGLIVVGLALLAMILSIWRVMRSNILLLRREAARSTHQPFWIRFKLDLIAAVLALAGFGFSLYLSESGILDAHTRVLILPLTSLVGVLFLLIGALLLFLRAFPVLLRLGERLAARNRGVAPVLALTQMARAPRQSLRMTLLFALSVAFAVFTLIFSQTQLQRLPELTNFQVGGDISGQISLNLVSLPFDQQRDFFAQIKGVTSVTLAATKQVTGGSQNSVGIDFRAVDASTYASTIYWTEQDGSQSINTLMQELISQRTSAEKRNIIPAIIDDAAAQALGVSVGKQFVLNDSRGPLTYVVVAVVHYIPTIYDSAITFGNNTIGGSQDSTDIPQGGVLVDFDTQNAVSIAVNEEGIFPDTVWLRTTDRPSDLAHIRNVLFSGTYQLSSFQDRRASLQSLTDDPLALAMIGILEIGAGAALLLSLFGLLLVSWLSARSRRVSFAVMRALGTAPRQIVGILLWEQGIVYTVALALGVGMSVLLSLLILPVFVFTPLATNSVTGFSQSAINPAANNPNVFFVIQIVPAVHILIPALPVAALLGGLVLICICALTMMVRVVTRPHMSQELRVDED